MELLALLLLNLFIMVVAEQANNLQKSLGMSARNNLENYKTYSKL